MSPTESNKLTQESRLQSTEGMGLIRGVTASALLVREQVEIEEGDWPKSGEILIGRFVATKLGYDPNELTVGKTLEFEGRTWTISGIFSANHSVFESEIWCRLDELQQVTKRQDLSLLAVTLSPEGEFADFDIFCKDRQSLELQAMREVDYYASLQRDYAPIRWLGWLMVVLVASAGVFAGLNTMYGSVVGRIRELATLQTIGFVRRAMVLSLIQEGMLLGATASLIAVVIANLLINEAEVRFTMGAFSLVLDQIALLIGCLTGLLLGILGAIPPAIRALRIPIAEGLKSV